MELKERYLQVSQELNEAEIKLTQLTLEFFVLNPSIKELTKQVQTLKSEKEMLEKELKEESDG